MNLQAVSSSVDIGDGLTVTLETGKMARQADGAVVLTVGKTVILATVVSAQKPREGVGFFPLSVDYQEKFAAAGRIPGGFHKRETKLSDYEVLISRLVDRALRPLFPEGYVNDTQILISLLSSDPTILPDSYAALAASAALAVSDIPFPHLISEVRVARINGKFVINPLRADMENADIDIILAASYDNIMMVEGEAKECSEEDLLEAIKTGHAAIRQHIDAQHELVRKAGAKEKRTVATAAVNEELKTKVEAFLQPKIAEVAKAALSKQDRKARFSIIKEELGAFLGEEATDEDKAFAAKVYEDTEYSVVRETVLSDRIRLDGRKLDEIRPIVAETSILPMPHGSALFTRGETQSLTTVTLGTPDDELMLDKAGGIEYKQFILHYNFPPFSTGEVKPMRAPGRREVGHGNLALRSLKQVLPSELENPYTVRVVSDILESNGSSSMATVCAGSLALMDAGVKIKAAVSGIAMGMISDPQDPKRYAILSDILGDEDHLGDMDFKVTGTEKGICGCQMDIKIDGLSFETLYEALLQAKKGRLHILGKMNEALESPRADYKPHAPRIETVLIPREFIGQIIGPGGKHIQELQRTTGTSINIEEVGEQGKVTIASANREGLDTAMGRIRAIAAVPEVGEVYDAIVKSVMPYGAFVEFLPGKQGLLHISEVEHRRLDSLDGVLKESDRIKVKLIGLDEKTGKFKLSRKVLLPKV
ncbi:MAG: polyribonucleotide nucleotidyltransferase [Sphingobacteriales bacterium]|nr:polyribonucleotide nucleotidyltransferase [Sphingobacteriales bacterium]